MVRGRLTRRIGRARIIAAILLKPPIVLERAVYLISRNVQEPEVFPPRAKPLPIRECGFKQDIGPNDIGVNEFSRTIDRTVDMASPHLNA
jgi:hypothetical protein